MFSVLTLCQHLDSSLNWCISQLLWPGSLATLKSPDLVIPNPCTWYTGKKSSPAVLRISSNFLEAFYPCSAFLPAESGKREFQHILCNSEYLKSCPHVTIFWGKGHFMWFWQESGSGNLHNTYCYPVDVLVFHLKIFCWVKSRLGKLPVYPIYIIFQSRRKCYVPAAWHNCRTCLCPFPH